MTIGDSLFHKSWGPFLSEDETERIKTQKFKYFFILIRIVGLIVDAMMKFSCWVIVKISFGHLIKIPNIFQPFSLQHSLKPSRLTPPPVYPRGDGEIFKLAYGWGFKYTEYTEWGKKYGVYAIFRDNICFLYDRKYFHIPSCPERFFQAKQRVSLTSERRNLA